MRTIRGSGAILILWAPNIKIQYWVQSTWPWVNWVNLVNQWNINMFPCLTSQPHSVMMKNCNLSCGNAPYLSEGLHHLSKWNCRRNIINLIYSLSLLSQMGLNSITIVKIIKSFVESRFAQLILRRNIKMIFQLNQSINNKIKKNRMWFLFSDI